MIQLAVTLVDMHTMALPSNCKNSVVICTVGNDKQTDRQTDIPSIHSAEKSLGLNVSLNTSSSVNFFPLIPSSLSSLSV